jgi:hypothetical protein
MEDLRGTVYTLVKEWSDTHGVDPHVILMGAGAATLLGKNDLWKAEEVGGHGHD